MAFVPDEQNPNANQTGAPGGQSAAQTASQAPITSSPAPTSGGTAGKSQNTATNQGPAQPFTNLQSYLTANEPQIQAQGNAIAGSLSGTYGQATGAIDQAKSDFGNQVNSGYAQNDPTVVNNFTQDPSKVAADPNQAKSFQSLYNDQYKGPDSFETTDQYGNLNNQVTAGKNLASQVSSPGGIQSYLMSQNPNESQGMATLDTSLINGNPEVAQQISAAAQPLNTLGDYLNTATTSADQSVAAAKAAADATRTGAQGAAATVNTNFGTDLAARLAAANDSYKNINNTYSKDYSDYTTLRDIPGQISGLVSSYAAPTIDAPTAPNVVPPSYANVATTDDFARANALQSLAGLTTPLQGVDASKAGTFNPTYTDTFNGTGAAGKIAQQLFDPSSPAYTQNVPQGNVDQLNKILAILNGYNGLIPTTATGPGGVAPAPVNIEPTLGGGVGSNPPPPTGGTGGSNGPGRIAR